MFVIAFYVPEDSAERVKEAMFTQGAGRIGDYEKCCWQTLGQGQFKPLKGANPAIGEVGSLETVKELKVEMVVDREHVKSVLDEMIRHHPYEEPAYHVFETLAAERL